MNLNMPFTLTHYFAHLAVFSSSFLSLPIHYCYYNYSCYWYWNIYVYLVDVMTLLPLAWIFEEQGHSLAKHLTFLGRIRKGSVEAFITKVWASPKSWLLGPVLAPVKAGVRRGDTTTGLEDFIVAIKHFPLLFSLDTWNKGCIPKIWLLALKLKKKKNFYSILFGGMKAYILLTFPILILKTF